MTGSRAPNPRGEALVEELKWVHSMIRRDLRKVRKMAADVADGLPAKQVQAGIRSLATNGPLWQLKVNCLQYCHFVHSHHNAESAMIFPALRRSNPALNPVVDKLEADHANVAGLLDEVEGAARALGSREDPAVRQRLTQALQRLADDLLAHLQYEEEQISDTLRTWTKWPFR
ncbi:hemerythrin domain-containing protein [Micromonospora sp. ATA32]|nr:hemerythrin domain-containing protein [Micromonospora sp. ATA32]